MMYPEASYAKKDQQVPILSLDSGVDPTPLLEEILTHEQNTCIQIRDTCTLMAQSVRDVLGSPSPQGGYVQSMQDRLGELEKAVNTLETTIKRKSVFSNDFLESASQRWFEKRLSSQSRKRRLRNFRRKEGSSHDSPPTPTSVPSHMYTFLPFEKIDMRYQSAPSTPSSPPTVPSPHSPIQRPFVPSLPSITVPSTSPNNSPRSVSSSRSPSACVPSTPSYPLVSAPYSPTSSGSKEQYQPQRSNSKRVDHRGSATPTYEHFKYH